MIETMHGHIEHRLLLNYTADPDVVAPLLPDGLRPHLARHRAVVGACILRLGQLRPPGLPRWAGVTSDNAAHRIAVEWDGPTSTEVGVYVLRRDSAQRLPVWLGGRVFPGVHGRARFNVQARGDALHVDFHTTDGLEVDVTADLGAPWTSRVFDDPDEASAFFERGARGWSPGRRGRLDGVAMASSVWRAEPVGVTARSSFYDDPSRFPPGSIELDGALLMQALPVEWRRIDATTARAEVPSVTPSAD